MPEEFADLLFSSPIPPGNYIEPTCAADLSVGSEAQAAMETATYPSYHKTVRWFPVVGIATEPPQDAAGQAILWELLFTFLPMVPTEPGNWSPLSPANSDLIVPADSQRNYLQGGQANFGAGENFSTTAHILLTAPGGGVFLEGETTSNAISIKVDQLLSTSPFEFDTAWSLGQ